MFIYSDIAKIAVSFFILFVKKFLVLIVVYKFFEFICFVEKKTESILG